MKKVIFMLLAFAQMSLGVKEKTAEEICEDNCRATYAKLLNDNFDKKSKKNFETLKRKARSDMEKCIMECPTKTALNNSKKEKKN